MCIYILMKASPSKQSGRVLAMFAKQHNHHHHHHDRCCCCCRHRRRCFWVVHIPHLQTFSLAFNKPNPDARYRTPGISPTTRNVFRVAYGRTPEHGIAMEIYKWRSLDERQQHRRWAMQVNTIAGGLGGGRRRCMYAMLFISVKEWETGVCYVFYIERTWYVCEC